MLASSAVNGGPWVMGVTAHGQVDESDSTCTDLHEQYHMQVTNGMYHLIPSRVHSKYPDSTRP